MGTRLYITSKTSAVRPATIRGAWDDTTQISFSASRSPVLDSSKTFDNSPTQASRGLSSAGPRDVILIRGVSGPLAAQTISGTVQVNIQVAETSSANADMFYHIHIYVTQGDTDTLRGTLLTDYVDSVNEWALNSLPGTTLDAAQALTPVVISDGDRIVVEIGYKSKQVGTTLGQGLLNYGTHNSSGNILNDQIVGSTTQGAPYIDFSATLVESISAKVHAEGVETILVPTPQGRIYSEGAEALLVPQPDAKIYSIGAEVLLRNSTGVTIQVPEISGTGSFSAVPVTGSGSIEIQPPLIEGYILNGPIRLTQMGRQVVEEAASPTLRVTQIGRQVVQEASSPSIRLTQMARQVLYRYTCETPDENPPPLIDTPIVHITNIRPRWMLERMDIKRRGEDTAAARKDNSFTTPPTWADDGIRWMLERFDVKRRDEET